MFVLIKLVCVLQSLQVFFAIFVLMTFLIRIVHIHAIHLCRVLEMGAVQMVELAANVLMDGLGSTALPHAHLVFSVPTVLSQNVLLEPFRQVLA